MSLLNVQLKVEKDSLEYMQLLETWLNNYTWEKYTNIEDNGENSENRITRKL